MDDQEMELIEKANRILEASNEARKSIAALFEPPFTFAEITEALTALVRAAEELKPEPGQGGIKHELVQAVWNKLDKEFGITERIDDLIDFNWIVERFDGPIIRKGIDMLIIATVTALNSVKWGKA